MDNLLTPFIDWNRIGLLTKPAAAKASRDNPPAHQTGPKDLRHFIRELMGVMPGSIKAVDRETDPRFGCTALGELFARQNEYPPSFFGG